MRIFKPYGNRYATAICTNDNAVMIPRYQVSVLVTPRKAPACDMPAAHASQPRKIVDKFRGI